MLDRLLRATWRRKVATHIQTTAPRRLRARRATMCTTTLLPPWLRRQVATYSIVTLILASVAAAATALTEEFTVTRAGESLVVRLQSPPPERLAPNPLLLLFFSTDRRASLPDGAYGAPGKRFLDEGHRVASFDLPAHGDRVDRHGSGIAGLRARVVAGEKPFDTFVADGRAVIDECLRRGLATADRIVTCGVSRGGYCALRLAAAEPRIAAVAAFAPATDWRFVTEFAAVKDHPEVAALALTHHAAALAGRRVYLAIGNHDRRAETNACTAFVLAIGEAEVRAGIAPSRLRYLIVDDSLGHALAAPWRHAGIQFLLQETRPAGAVPAP